MTRSRYGYTAAGLRQVHESFWQRVYVRGHVYLEVIWTLHMNSQSTWRWDSVVRIVNWLRSGRYGVRNPASVKYISLLRNVQTASGVCPFSVGTRDPFSGHTAGRACGWLVTIWGWGSEWVEPYLQLIMPSWRTQSQLNVLLKKRLNKKLFCFKSYLRRFITLTRDLHPNWLVPPSCYDILISFSSALIGLRSFSVSILARMVPSSVSEPTSNFLLPAY